jgi:hypothetical protein
LSYDSVQKLAQAFIKSKLDDHWEMPNVKVQMPNDNELVGCISLIGFIG